MIITLPGSPGVPVPSERDGRGASLKFAKKDSVCYLFQSIYKRSTEAVPAISDLSLIHGWSANSSFEVYFGEEQNGFLPAS
jgi:hypothetical protein